MCQSCTPPPSPPSPALLLLRHLSFLWLKGGEEHCFPPQGDRAERSFCQEITPPFPPWPSTLSEVASEGGEHMAQSPPHLDPEETDEEWEMKRLSAHLTDGVRTCPNSSELT